jgi:hypothetical protein
VPLLLNAGHRVVGTTRSTAKADGLRAAGVESVVVDVFDAPALSAAVLEAHPDIVVHQLTDLPPGLDPSQMTEGTRRNARMRSQGTENLVAAALDAGVRRLVAQSIAWMYAPGKEPHSEDDVLDIDAGGTRAITMAGVATLERRFPLRQSTESSFAMGISTVPEPEPTRQRRRLCMSMRPPGRRYWRSRKRVAASTTSPSRADPLNGKGAARVRL